MNSTAKANVSSPGVWGPWQAWEWNSVDGVVLHTSGGDRIANVLGDRDTAEANADLIITCVNFYDVLVAALREISNLTMVSGERIPSDIGEIARAALNGLGT